MPGASRGATLRRPYSTMSLALASLTVLIAAVGLGLRLPGTALLDPFPGLGRIDYSAGPPGGFAPLDPGLVDSRLGTTAAGDSAAEATTAGRAQRGDTGAARVSRQAGPGVRDLGTPSLPPPLEVEHAFANDDFRNAYRIPSIPFTARTATTGSTAEPGEPRCGPLAGRSAWYVYTAPRDVGLLADTFGSDVALSLTVYTGSRVDRLTRVPDTECSSDARGNALSRSPRRRERPTTSRWTDPSPGASSSRCTSRG